MKNIIADIKEYSVYSNPFAVILWNRGFHIILVYRISHFLAKTKILTPISAILTRFIQILYGADIHWNAKIGPACRILHGVGIVIAAQSKIGSYCSIYHGVTIGIRKEWTDQLPPVIGDHVKIYTGAKIIGSIKIGDKVEIGANAVVTKDCEPGANYAGVPAKKIEKK